MDFNSFPLMGVYLLTLLTVWLSYKLAYQLGIRAKNRKLADATIASTVAATMGLLAFMLAFTFGFAANRFQERIHLMIDDVNVIETTYLRAGYLPEPYRTSLRTLLCEYADIRSMKERIKKVIERSEAIQKELWKQGEEIAKQSPTSIVTGLFIQSLNELIDIHTKRIVIGLKVQIPGVIWVTLYILTFLSIGTMGYHAGLTNSCSLGIHIVLIVAFCSVVLLIVDLDRPAEGYLQINQQPMLDLFQRLDT